MLRSRLVLGCFAVASAALLTAGRSAGQRPLTVIAYGDMRFTDPSNVTAANPAARRALVARIAAERPDALLLNGDVPWHGGDMADYDEFRTETLSWRAAGIRIFPSLGNHEFSGCAPEVCLEHWWTAFPALRGTRWYSEALTPSIRIIALDTNSSLLPDSEQHAWLQHELVALPASVQFVLITLHHPPVADVQTRVEISHNPRPNETALVDVLARAASTRRARFIVLAGHIHNYERHLQDEVVYLVAGGGGAKPVYVDRTADDLDQAIDFPNFHYVKLSIGDGSLKGAMYRLDEPDAPTPHFTVKDTFDVRAQSAPTSTSQ